MKDNQNKGKIIHVHGLEDLILLRMIILPKATHRFNAIPFIIPTAFFVEMDRLILKLTWKCKGPGIANTILRKKNNTGVSKLSKKQQ